MSQDQVQEHISRVLLGVMTGSGAYDYFKAGSDFFKLLAPYLTAISFILYIWINRKKIFKRNKNGT